METGTGKQVKPEPAREPEPPVGMMLIGAAILAAAFTFAVDAVTGPAPVKPAPAAVSQPVKAPAVR
jgi:hypothetical protein